MNLDITVWDDIRQVSDAAVKGCHQEKEIHPRLLMASVSRGALPDDVQHYSASMSAMPGWLVTQVS